jgi:hypothetical protein
MNFVLRLLLLVWVVGYVVGSCSPILNGHFVLGTIAFLGGVIFFIPWVIGIVVLWFLIKATNPPPR